MEVKTILTLGRKTELSYSGSIYKGVVLFQSGKPRIEPRLFAEALQRFAGQSVYGGFSEDNPTPNGFGEWLQKESARFNSRKLTSRHGSFVAAILCAEAGVTSHLEGNAVVLQFPKIAR